MVKIFLALHIVFVIITYVTLMTRNPISRYFCVEDQDFNDSHYQLWSFSLSFIFSLLLVYLLSVIVIKLF